jgi:hypothetical protein
MATSLQAKPCGGEFHRTPLSIGIACAGVIDLLRNPRAFRRLANDVVAKGPRGPGEFQCPMSMDVRVKAGETF